MRYWLKNRVIQGMLLFLLMVAFWELISRPYFR